MSCHIYHSPGLLPMLYSTTLHVVGENKTNSQLIHLVAQKSHYPADEFKDCLRWKGTMFMARQSCVPSLVSWMKNKRHVNTPAKWMLNTSLFKYLMILRFKHVFLKGSYVLFIWWLLNEDKCGLCCNWSDLSHHVRVMNLTESTLLVWYRDIGNPNFGSHM